jgi:hypothetical protein
MRFILKLAAAFGFFLATQGHAFAFVQVDVDLSSQTMQVRSSSGETYLWPISSGRSGYPTPRGVFRPRALYTMVHSAKYGNAPMPHSIFFYGQYAIHGTMAVGALGRPASHGCIRLSPGNAATLFAMVQSQGAQIRIIGASDIVVARRAPSSGSVLGYAPIRRARTLSQWARNPLAR